MATAAVQTGWQPAFDIRPLNSAGRTDELFGAWLGAQTYADRCAGTRSVIGWRVRCTTRLPNHVGMGVTSVGNAVVTYTGDLLIAEAEELAHVRHAFTEALRGNIDFSK